MFPYAWSILCESAIYVLGGFFIAGLLDALISARRLVGLLRWMQKVNLLVERFGFR